MKARSLYHNFLEEWGVATEDNGTAKPDSHWMNGADGPTWSGGEQH